MDFSYQETGIQWLRPLQRAYLGDEAGLGKSRQLLLAAEPPVLVVAPAMVLDGGVWADEHARWRPDAEVATSSYHGLVEKVPGPKGGASFTKNLAPELRREWGTVIFDEAHYLKGRQTNWTHAAYDLVKRAGRVYQASGTPIPNWAHELFVPLTLLRPTDSKSGGYLGSYWRWVGEWFEVGPKYSKSGRLVSQYYVDGGTLKACSDECNSRPPEDPCEHWRNFYATNFGSLMLRRLRDDVLKDLPPLVVQEVRLEMGKAQAKAYRELKKDFVTWVAETGAQVTAWTQAAQFVKLMLASTGLPTLDANARTGSAKLDALEDLLIGRSRPDLVLCFYRNTAQAVARLCDRLGLRYASIGRDTSKLGRRRAVQTFQAGGLDVLIGSIEVVAEGLTLTRADRVIFVERHWRPSRNEQAMRRVHRIGQLHPVTAVQLYTMGTYDWNQKATLEAKTDSQLRALAPSRFLELL